MEEKFDKFYAEWLSYLARKKKTNLVLDFSLVLLDMVWVLILVRAFM